jgi:hypothetical protein
MKKIFLLLIICNQLLQSKGQSIGIGTSNPAASAALDVNSTTKGTLITRMNSSQRKAISNPATGLLVFDIDKNTIYMYDGVSWLPMLFARNENSLPPFPYKPEDGGSLYSFGWSVDIKGNYAIVGSSGANVNGNSLQGCAYIFFRNNGGWQLQQKIFANDGVPGDHFGYSVSIDSNYAVAGAYWDDHVNGSGNREGSTYVFVRNGNTWTQQAKLIANDPAEGDWFGYAVSISNGYIAASAPFKDISTNTDRGAVYIYSIINGVWTYRTRITHLAGAHNDFFGYSIHLDNTQLIVGAPNNDINSNVNEGSAFIFSRTGNLWSQVAELYAASSYATFNLYLGTSVSISGNYAVVGAPGYNNPSYLPQTAKGIAIIYEKLNGVWTRVSSVRPSDLETGLDFGSSVAIAGDAIVVGGKLYNTGTIENQGRCWVYKRSGANWPLYRTIDDVSGVTGGKFGSSVAIDGFNILIGAFGKNGERGEVFFSNVE